MMFLLMRDKKLTKSQFSPTHASTERKITDELKHNAGWYKVREGSPVKVQWAVRWVGEDLWWKDLLNSLKSGMEERGSDGWCDGGNERG